MLQRSINLVKVLRDWTTTILNSQVSQHFLMVSLAIFMRNDAVGTLISVNCSITKVYPFGQGLGFWIHNSLKPKVLYVQKLETEN